jgi:hypothetical protein
MERELNGEVGGSESGRSISTDELFFTLSNERRRHVLDFLRGNDDAVEMRTLVREVAARERGVPVAELTYDQRKSVYVSLRQTHLPKMSTLGIIDYDSDAGSIRLVDGIADFEFYYEPVHTNDVDWGQFYVGLAALMGLFAGVTTAGIFPFGLVPRTLLPWLVLAPFAVAGGIHTYLTRRRQLDVGLPKRHTSNTSRRRRNGN